MAETEQVESTTSEEEQVDHGADGDESQLGDAGKKALYAERKARREAEARIRELEPLATKAQEIEEANKSDIEKAQEKASKAEAELAKIPEMVAGSLREHLITIHEIGDEDAELFLTASDPGLLIKQAERLVGRKSEQRRNGNYVPREGATSSPSPDPRRDFVRSLTGQG